MDPTPQNAAGPVKVRFEFTVPKVEKERGRRPALLGAARGGGDQPPQLPHVAVGDALRFATMEGLAADDRNGHCPTTWPRPVGASEAVTTKGTGLAGASGPRVEGDRPEDPARCGPAQLGIGRDSVPPELFDAVREQVQPDALGTAKLAYVLVLALRCFLQDGSITEVRRWPARGAEVVRASA